MINVIFIGAPGSGKGTQAENLVKSQNLRHLSTGNLFRAHLKERSPLGLLAKSYIGRGELVPDQLTNDMVEDFLNGVPRGTGVLFDGFPRNLSQAKTLDHLLKKFSRNLKKVIFLDLPDSALVERLTGRLWAPKSGCVYHIRNRPPKRPGFCDQSGEALVTRPDDREELLSSRLKVFHEETRPLLNYYREKNCFTAVEAGARPEEVFQRILKVLDLQPFPPSV